MLMTIQHIVRNILVTQMLTPDQAMQINLMLRHKRFDDSDLGALEALIEALSSNEITVLPGMGSLESIAG